MPRIVIALLLTCGLARAAVAQSETPEAVAQRYVSAMRETDWGKAATLMHPSALQQLRSLFDPILLMDSPEADGVRREIFGFPTKQAAIAASDSALFVNLMSFTIGRQEGMESAMRTTQFSHIGTVTEGRDTVHVLGRMSMRVMDLPVSQLEVISLMRYGNSWRGVLKGDLVTMAAGLRKALERKFD
jgi:hypothetical protein